MTHEARTTRAARHRTAGRHAEGLFPMMVLAAAASLAVSAPANAQQEPPAGAKDGTEARTPTRLEAVIVTAERRGENVRDVPNAISVLQGDLLDVLGSSGQDVRSMSARTPSLNIESSFGRAFPRFYIRGLGNTDFDLNASQPVSLLLDDVVQENPLLKGFPMFDIARVEVLRGPQGTLFGRNSPAGVIKFESELPRLGKSAGYVSLGIGSYHALNAEGAMNIPISDTLAARASFLSQSRGDWVTNTAPNPPNPGLEGYNDRAARFQLLYQPGTQFSALVNVHGRALKGTARLFRANIIKPGTNDLIDNFDVHQVSMDGRNSQEVNTDGESVRLKWTFGDVSLTSITAHEHVWALSRADVDGGYGAAFAPPSGPGVIPFPVETADGLPKHRQLTQELRLQSDYKTGLNWLAGLYYFDERIVVDSFSYDSLKGNVQNGYAQQKQDNKAAAAYGSLIYPLGDDLKLRGGLRYTHDSKDFTATRYQSPFGAPNVTASAAPRDSDVSWDLSATYTLNKDVNLYARAAKGFRAPTVQGRLLFGDTISVGDSERVLSFEAGTKANLLDKRAQVSFNVFRYTVKNQQLTARKTGTFYEEINAERTVGQGFELDLRANVTDNLLVSASLSRNSTHIRDKNLVATSCNCTNLNPPAPGGGVYVDGNPLPQAPAWVGSLTARYSTPAPNGGEFYAFTDWSYRGRANNGLAESVEYTLKPLLEGGLRLGYVSPKGNFEAAVFGRNITNKIQATGGLDFNNLAGMVNEPRTFGIQLRSSF